MVNKSTSLFPCNDLTETFCIRIHIGHVVRHIHNEADNTLIETAMDYSNSQYSDDNFPHDLLRLELVFKFFNLFDALFTGYFTHVPRRIQSGFIYIKGTTFWNTTYREFNPRIVE